jgi:hypothetical protein
MRPLWMILLIALVASTPVVQGQQLNTRSSLIFRSTIVTSSRVFDNPDAQDIVDRDHYDFVDNLLGGGLEYRIEFPDQNIFFTLSIEYATRLLDQTRPFLTVTSQLVQLPTKQGVRFVPVEIGAGTKIPLIEDVFLLTMGGGFGAYYADRVYEISGNSMKSQSPPFGYGIHVECGFDYRIFQDIGLRCEMRFRDPEIINESNFGTNYVTVGSNQIAVGNIPPKTKINVHGVSFTLGVLLGL